MQVLWVRLDLQDRLELQALQVWQGHLDPLGNLALRLQGRLDPGQAGTAGLLGPMGPPGPMGMPGMVVHN